MFVESEWKYVENIHLQDQEGDTEITLLKI